MVAFIRQWLSYVVLALVVVLACGAAWRWRRRLGGWPTRWLALGGLCAVLAGLGGITQTLAVHWLVAFRVPPHTLREVRSFDLGWLAYVAVGATIPILLSTAEGGERRRFAWLSALLATVSLGSWWAGRWCEDHVYALRLKLAPEHGLPAEWSSPGKAPRTVEMPGEGAISGLSLGYRTEADGYRRVWGCVARVDDVVCFSPESRALTVERALTEPVRSLAVGRGYGCGIGTHGLRCWGATPFSAELGSRASSFETAAGRACWIADGEGRCFRGGEAIDDVAAAAPLRQLSPAGPDGPCAVTTADEVLCAAWQLDAPPIWTSVSGLRAKRIAVLGSRGCAIGLDDTLSCWRGSEALEAEPHVEAPVRAVALGDHHACAITGGHRRVSCWGDDTWGQLGDGQVEDATHLAAVGATTCVVVGGERLLCWGRRQAH